LFFCLDPAEKQEQKSEEKAENSIETKVWDPEVAPL